MPENSVILTSPGIDNSLGHDKLCMLLNGALCEAGFHINHLTLKPTEPTNVLEEAAWKAVESGKHKFSENARNGHKRNILQRLAGNFVDASTSIVRSSMAFQQALTQGYRSELAKFPELPIISTHYMSFVPEHSGLMLTPDIHLHRATLSMLQNCQDVDLAIPQLPTFNFLDKYNPELKGRIKTQILPVSRQLKEAADMRLKRQSELFNQSDPTFNILVTTGASGPEVPEALEMIEMILKNPKDKWGRKYKIHALCGDQMRKHNELFADSLMHLQESYDNLSFELAGNRAEELQHWYAAMQNPYFDTVLSRPNEMLTIGPALGFRMLSLHPFQRHEQISLFSGMIQRGIDTNVSKASNYIYNSEFTGFERSTDIAGNYNKANFWCKAGLLDKSIVFCH